MTIDTLSHKSAIDKCEELAALVARHTDNQGNGAHATAIDSLIFMRECNPATAIQTVSEANLSERLGAVVVLDEATEGLSRTEVIWVDSGYSGENFARVVQQICGARVEVIERIAKTFEILPKRWLVERTFGWLNRYRRLSKDYELHSENSEAMIYGSLIRLMTRRLAAA